MQGDFQLLFSLLSLAHALLFFWRVEKQHALRNPVAHALCQDTRFKLDIFLCFLVLACLGLLLLSLPLPTPPTPSPLNSYHPPLHPPPAPFPFPCPCPHSLNLHQNMLLCEPECLALFSLRGTVTDFKLLHGPGNANKAVKRCGTAVAAEQTSIHNDKARRGFSSSQTAVVWLRGSEYLLSYGSV